jgi:hypothetical protein
MHVEKKTQYVWELTLPMISSFSRGLEILHADKGRLMYVKYSTLHCNIIFLLDDFSQMKANVNVLSICKVG